MDQITKPNDWFVSISLNPEMGLANFDEMGLNGDNTQLLPKDKYRETEFAQKLFKDDKGKFNDIKFNEFYDKALTTYGAFVDKQYDKDEFDNLEYSFTNAFSPKGSKISKDKFEIKKVPNPFKSKIGFQGLYSIEDSGLSISELAQQSKVVDFDSGKTLDWSPNDKNGVSSFFRDDLVLAQWDEDGTHINDYNENIQHKKGDLKINSTGDFFYETLGNRNASKKQFLSAFDTLTTDGTTINKFDFFDADDKEQKIAKTITRATLKYLPVAIGTLVGGPIGLGISQAYLGATAMLSLTDALPNLYKAVEGITTNNEDMSKRSGMWKAMNKLEATMGTYKTGVSEHSREQMFTWENTINMLSDVGLQLGQQRFIAKIPSYFKDPMKGVETITEAGQNVKKLNNFSRNLATTYMTITSGATAYKSAIQAGHEERTAGLIMLGTLAGLHGVMRSSIGQWPLKGIGLDDLSTQTRKAQQELATSLKEGMSEGLTTTAAKASFMKDISKSVGKKFSAILESPETLLGAALNESLEEVSEEMVQDFMMGLGSAASALGVTRKANWTYSGSDPLQRYLMSAFGGALGGSLHNINFKPWKKINESLDTSTKDDLIYHIWQYGADEVKNTINRNYNAKTIDFGSRKLSANISEKNIDGKYFFLDAQNEQNSQAWKVKEDMLSYVDTVNELLNTNGIEGPEVEARKTLFADQDPFLKTILDFKLKDRIKEHLMDSNRRIIDLQDKVNTDIENNVDPAKNQLLLNEAKTFRSAIVNGDHFDNYFKQGLLYMNADLAKPFIDVNIKEFTDSLYGKNYDTLSEDDKEEIQRQYNDYHDNKMSMNLEYGSRILDLGFKKLTPAIQSYNGEYYKARTQFSKVLGDEINNLQETLSVVNEDGIVDTTRLQKEPVDNSVNNIINQYFKPVIETNNFKKFLDTVKSISTQTHIDGEMKDKISEGIKLIKKNQALNINKIRLDSRINSDIDIDLKTKLNQYINDGDFDKINEFIDNFNLESYDLDYVLEDLEFDNTNKSEDDTIKEVTDIIKTELKNYVSKVKILHTNDQNIINELETISASSLDNPIYSLLNNISSLTDSKTDGLVDILKNENKRLVDNADNYTYIISSENKAPLFKLKEDINILKLLIKHSLNREDQHSHTQLLNYYLGKFGKNKELLATVDQDVAQQMINDLYDLELKLNFIIGLSNYNEGDKLRELKNIGLNFNTLFANLYDLDNPLNILNKMNSKLGGKLLVSIREYQDANKGLVDILKYNNDINNTEKQAIEYGALELYNTGLEDILFNNFSELSKGQNKLPEIIKDCFEACNFNSDPKVIDEDPENIFRCHTSTLSSKTKNLSDYDKWIYFLSVISAKSSDYKSKLYDVLTKTEEPSFKFAPSFSQEYPVRIGYSMLTRKGQLIFQLGLNNLKVGEHINKVNNILYINGYHGTGKTTATASLLHEIIKGENDKEEANYIISSIVDLQSNRFAEALNEEPITGINKQELLTKIFGKNYDSEKVEDYLKDDNFKGNELKGIDYIYIDEVTFYDKNEIKLLSKWATANKKLIICLGDSLQQGKDVNIDYVDPIKPPTIEYSMRQGSTIVKDNNNAIRNLTKQLDDVEYTKVSNKASIQADIFNKAIDSGSFMLKYFEAENNIVTGTKITKDFSNDDTLAYIETLIGNNAKPQDIAIIYDDSITNDQKEILNSISAKTNVKILPFDKMQGSEFDHVISYIKLNRPVSKHLDYAKRLNTILTRAKYGNLIIPSGDSTLEIKQIKLNFSSITDINPELLKQFRDERLNSLEVIREQFKSTETEEVKETKGGKGTKKDAKKTKIENNIIENNTPIFDSELEQTDIHEEVLEGVYGDNTSNKKEEAQFDEIPEKNDSKTLGYSSIMHFGVNYIEKDNIFKNKRERRYDTYWDAQLALPNEESIDYERGIVVSRKLDFLRKQILNNFNSDLNEKVEYDITKINNNIKKLANDKSNILYTINNRLKTDEVLKDELNNTDELDFNTGCFQLRYSPKASKLDSNKSIIQDKNYLNDINITQVLTYTITTKNGIKIDFPLCRFSLLQKEAKQEAKDIQNAILELINNGDKNTIVRRILKPEGLSLTGSSTRLFTYGKDKGMDISLSDYKKLNTEYAVMSEPMIYTGYELANTRAYTKIIEENKDNKDFAGIVSTYLNESYKKSLAGRAVIFVSKDPLLKDYTSDDLFNYYVKQKIRSNKLKNGEEVTDEFLPRVSMILLTPKTLNPTEYFTKLKEGLKNGGGKQVTTLGHRMVGFNILRGLYELQDIKLAEYNKISDKTSKKAVDLQATFLTPLNTLTLTISKAFKLKAIKFGDSYHIVFEKDGEYNLNDIIGAFTNLEEANSIENEKDINETFKKYYRESIQGDQENKFSNITKTLMHFYLHTEITNSKKNKKAFKYTDNYKYRNLIDLVCNGSTNYLPGYKFNSPKFKGGIYINPTYKTNKDNSSKNTIMEISNDPSDFFLSNVNPESTRVLIDYEQVELLEDFENNLKVTISEKLEKINNLKDSLDSSNNISTNIKTKINNAISNDESFEDIKTIYNKSINLKNINKSKNISDLIISSEITDDGFIQNEKLISKLPNTLDVSTINNVIVNNDNIVINTPDTQFIIQEDSIETKTLPSISSPEQLVKEVDNRINFTNKLNNLDSRFSFFKEILDFKETTSNFKKLSKEFNKLNPEDQRIIKELFKERVGIEC